MKIKSLIIICLLVISTVPIFGQVEDHYRGKTVQLLQPVPKSIPLVIFDRQGQPFDAALLKLKFERNGIGLEAGIFAVITDVRVSGREVIFKLVGTGTTAPPASMPASAIDEEIWDWGEGSVVVDLSKDVKELENPITRINNLLNNVMTTRELVSTEGLPGHIVEAVNRGEVIRGMNQRAVYIVLGPPDDIITELEDTIIKEAWIYRKQDMTTVTVLFRDGIVFLIKNY